MAAPSISIAVVFSRFSEFQTFCVFVFFSPKCGRCKKEGGEQRAEIPSVKLFSPTAAGVVAMWVRHCISTPLNNNLCVKSTKLLQMAAIHTVVSPSGAHDCNRFLWEHRETHTHSHTSMHAAFISLVPFYKRRRRDRWDSGLLKGVTCADVIRAPGWDSRAPFITM